MNKPKITPVGPGRRVSDESATHSFAPPAADVAGQIMLQLAAAEQVGKMLNAWDLRRKLDRPLPQILVGLRALEFAGLISGAEGVYDPLDRSLALTDKGRDLYCS